MDHAAGPNDTNPRDAERNSGISLLDLQIRRHERLVQSESHLSRAVNWAADFLRSPEADSLSSMKQLKSDLEQHQQANNADRIHELEKQIKDLVRGDQSTLQWRREVSQYGSGIFKTGALFFPGAGGRVAAALLYGADQARAGDCLSMQVVDGSLGVLKGGLMHKAMSTLGAGTVGIAGKGVMIGTVSRALDIGLDRQSYVASNRFDFNLGVSRLGERLVDPTALMVDAGTFVVSHGLVKGANRFSGGLVETWRPLSTIGTGFSFGMTAGALGEIDRQRTAGEEFNLRKIAARSFVQGGFDALAAIPGGIAASPGSAGAIKDSLRRYFTREAALQGRISPVLSVAADSAAMLPHVLSLESAAIEKSAVRSGGRTASTESVAAGAPTLEASAASGLRQAGQPLLAERKDAAVSGESQLTTAAASLSERRFNAPTSDARLLVSAELNQSSSERAAAGGSSMIRDGKLLKTGAGGSESPTNGKAITEVSESAAENFKTTGNGQEKYLSDRTDADGTRNIVKLDGTRVTIGTDGKFKVEYPEGHSKLLREQELQAKLNEPKKEKEPRFRHQPPDFSHMPLAERPVNVGSSNAELVAREMSNFENSPFVLDGRTFASVEGFYVWLKWSGDPAKQALAQNMHGAEAKKFGKPSKNTTAEYNGETIVLGSPEHHALIKRAIQAKVEQHPDLARRFAETHPRPLLHDLGYPEPPSRLPAKDFCRILGEIRQGLVDGTIVTKDGPVSQLSEKARVKESSKDSYPVSDIMRSWIGDEVVGRNRNLDLYAQAFEGFEHKVTRLLASGGDCLSFEMPNGHVLKITSRTLGERFGGRPFDLHMVEKGSRAANGVSINYFIQPRTDTAVSYNDYKSFCADLSRLGYVMADGGPEQLGRYNGAVKLLDPFAVEKLD